VLLVPRRSPVSSKVSRIAASASARPRSAEAFGTRAISAASALGWSVPEAGIRRSLGSIRPPGKTNLPGMKR
jgi:hypothetical protein